MQYKLLAISILKKLVISFWLEAQLMLFSFFHNFIQSRNLFSGKTSSETSWILPK